MGFKLEHLLVPVAFQPSCEPAIERAIALAADYRADVTLLHVVEAPFFGFDSDGAEAERIRASELLRALVQGKIRELRKLHAWRGVAMTEVSFGSPADEIVDSSERLDAQMIVMGMSSGSSIAHAVRASTTDRVVRRARCPVVVVRPPTWARLSPEAALDETARAWGLAA